MFVKIGEKIIFLFWGGGIILKTASWLSDTVACNGCYGNSVTERCHALLWFSNTELLGSSSSSLALRCLYAAKLIKPRGQRIKLTAHVSRYISTLGKQGEMYHRVKGFIKFNQLKMCSLYSKGISRCTHYHTTGY